MSTMGVALRHLGGNARVEVMTRVRDFNIMTMQDPQGKPATVPADTLISFSATQFREIENDVWEFRTHGDDGSQRLLYVRGEDLLIVRCVPQVA